MSFSSRLVFAQLATDQSEPEVGVYAVVAKVMPPPKVCLIASGCGTPSQWRIFEIGDDGPDIKGDLGDPEGTLEFRELMVRLGRVMAQPAESQGNVGVAASALEGLDSRLSEIRQAVRDRLASLGKTPTDQSVDRPTSVPQAGRADAEQAGADAPAPRL